MDNEKKKYTGYGLYFLEVAMVFGMYQVFGIFPGLIGILAGYFTKQTFEQRWKEPWKVWALAIVVGLITAVLLAILTASIPFVTGEA